ncbi:MAG: DNA polymerase III subunit delta [Bacilli bacterium]|nr:DNA polymerase III subunit delta [Bacilli bacterium]
MIHLIFSEQDVMAKEAASKLIKKDFPEKTEFNFVSFDMLVTPLKDAARECETLSFAFDRKCVVLENCQFLKSRTKWKPAKDDRPEELLEYLKHPNPDVDLYFLLYDGAVDTKNQYYKAIIDAKGVVDEVKNLSPEDWLRYIPSYFAKRGGKIDPQATRELSLRIDGDYGRFKNEADKLLSYANGEDITLGTIEEMVAPYVEDDVYKMSNALTRGDNHSALKIYRDLKSRSSIDEITLIGLLAKQFVFLDQVRFLDAKGYDSRMIGQELGCKPIRAEIAMKSLFRISEQRLSKIMEQLYATDKSILSGRVLGEYAFTLFLTNFRLA